METVNINIANAIYGYFIRRSVLNIQHARRINNISLTIEMTAANQIRL